MNKKWWAISIILIGILLIVIIFSISLSQKSVVKEQEADESFLQEFFGGIRDWFSDLFSDLFLSPDEGAGGIFGGGHELQKGEPNCEFILPADGTEFSIDPHIIASSRVNCDCNVQEVINVILDNEKIFEGTERFKYLYNEEINPRKNKEILVMPYYPLALLSEGQHHISARVNCLNGKNTEVSTTFTVTKEDFSDYAIENVFEEAQESESGLSSGVSTGVITGNFVQDGPSAGTGSQCRYNIQGVFPYFNGEHAGQVSAHGKKFQFTNIYGPAASGFINGAISSVNPSFSNMLLVGGNTIPDESLSDPSGGILGWNINGLAKLVKEDGSSYYGVAAPEIAAWDIPNTTHITNFLMYAEAVKAMPQHEGKVPIIMVDEFVLSTGSVHPQLVLGGKFDPDRGVIFLDINTEGSFLNFRRSPELQFSLSQNRIASSLAHEVAHISLGHWWIDIHNLMVPLNSEFPLVFAPQQRCALAYGCFNSDPNDINSVWGHGFDYGKIESPSGIIQYTCDNSLLEANDEDGSILKEECEGQLLGVNEVFPLNCSLDNPAPHLDGDGKHIYDSGKKYGKYEYTTNLACYKYPVNTPSGVTPPLENHCQVEEYCGNGFIEDGRTLGSGYETIDLGEECDYNAIDVYNFGCPTDQFCNNGDEPFPDKHCLCVCPLGQHKVTGCGGCCPNGEECYEGDDGEFNTPDDFCSACPAGFETCGENCCDPDNDEYCDEDSLVCVDNSCDSDNDCSPGEICIDGQCGDDGGVNPPSGSSGGRGDEPGVNLECPEGSECEPGSTYCEATYGPGWTCTTADEFGTCKCHPP